jgi:large exoprotein involved in heme utilization and adhesion
LTNGAQLLASTFGQGDAGRVTVAASGSISLDGVGRTGVSSNIGSVVNSGAVGKGGDVNVTSGSLFLTNGAGVSVNSNGSGSAGDLTVRAGTVTLDRGASITAATTSTEGGNINLQAQDLLLVRRNSNISSTAGNSQNGGNGGIITINTPLLVAVPLENSDISANAFRGNGGRVNINITGGGGIFGIQSRTQKTSQSDITANSTGGGINGVVNINTVQVDPSRGLVTLPVVPVNVVGLIAQGCPADVGPRASKFVITGRGGLPPNPSQPLSSDAVLTSWATLNPRVEHSPSSAGSTKPTSAAPTPIVPATGWVFNGKGEVTLTASAPTVTPDIPWLTPTTCHAQ